MNEHKNHVGWLSKSIQISNQDFKKISVFIVLAGSARGAKLKQTTLEGDRKYKQLAFHTQIQYGPALLASSNFYSALFVEKRRLN